MVVNRLAASRVTGFGGSKERPGPIGLAREALFTRLQDLITDSSPGSDQPDSSGRDSGTGKSYVNLRSIDDELAALVYDSAVDGDFTDGGDLERGRARSLTFAAGDLVLELEVSWPRRLVGQIVPAEAASVELRHRGRNIPMTTDELGFFRLGTIPEGPISIRCRPTSSLTRSVATSWFLV